MKRLLFAIALTACNAHGVDLRVVLPDDPYARSAAGVNAATGEVDGPETFAFELDDACPDETAVFCKQLDRLADEPYQLHVRLSGDGGIVADREIVLDPATQPEVVMSFTRGELPSWEPAVLGIATRIIDLSTPKTCADVGYTTMHVTAHMAFEDELVVDDTLPCGAPAKQYTVPAGTLVVGGTACGNTCVDAPSVEVSARRDMAGAAVLTFPPS